MAKGNKKRGNQCRRRAAIRQKMAETGQSYTTRLRQRAAGARDGEPAETRSTKLSDVFEGRRFPLPFGPMAEVAKWQMEQIAASKQIGWYVNHVTKQLQAEVANSFADAIKDMNEQADAMLQAAMVNPIKDMNEQADAMLQAAMEQLNPIGDAFKYLTVR